MKPIVIIGAGIAGLTCAGYLHRAGRSVIVLEQSDHFGGRVWSDTVDGFTLDHGFQVLLNSYPEVNRCLNMSALALGKFQPGAMVRIGHCFRRIVDPLRDPGHTWDTLKSGAFTAGDMLRVLKLRTETRRLLETDDALHDQSTHDYLISRGFSERAIQKFFRPFFSGVFLDDALDTPADMFAFVFRMFSTGSACLPAGGMCSIPLQLADRLPDDAIRLNTEVLRLNTNQVTLEDESTIEAESIVLATDYSTTARLLDHELAAHPWRSTATFYFRTATPPSEEPILYLNGTGQGSVNSVVIPTNVCSTYSSTSDALISVSMVGEQSDTDDQLQRMLRKELTPWFGESVNDWRYLMSYRVPYALPTRFGASAGDFTEAAKAQGVLIAGDFLVNPSLNGAMASGRIAAEHLLATAVS